MQLTFLAFKKLTKIMYFTYLYIYLIAGNDLDSIRALFSEKEKELSLAVAKVEALTRQLEELRRDRRGPLNLIPGNGTNNTGTNGVSSTSAASVELEKLRRELMVSKKIYFYKSFSFLC